MSSRLPFELFLALRYLRPKRTFVSVITLICVIGVMLGVAVLIIVISVMSGFDKQLRDKILGFNSHIRISPDGHTMREYDRWLQLVRTNKDIVGVAPYVLGQVLTETQPPDGGSSRVLAQWVRGVDPKYENDVSVLLQSIVAGTNNLKGKGVLVGRDFAGPDSMNLHVGDTLSIYSIRNLTKMREAQKKGSEEAILPDDYEVRGIFDVGHFEYNSSIIVVSLANAQDLYDINDSVHGLMVKLRDPYLAGSVAASLRDQLGPELDVRTWMQENSGILGALAVEKDVMFYLLFFIMIVAAFGIASAQITFVYQKTREIGILRALGATRAQIMRIFVLQSFVVGVIGVLAGFSLGLLMVNYRNEFLFAMRRVTGFELFPAQIYTFRELPALISASDIAVICGGSLVMCLVAGFLPAWTASKLKPVEALRRQ